MSFLTPDLTPLIREFAAFKINQQVQSAQIIALLQEQNQLLKETLTKK